GLTGAPSARGASRPSASSRPARPRRPKPMPPRRSSSRRVRKRFSKAGPGFGMAVSLGERRSESGRGLLRPGKGPLRLAPEQLDQHQVAPRRVRGNPPPPLVGEAPRRDPDPVRGPREPPARFPDTASLVFRQGEDQPVQHIIPPERGGIHALAQALDG